MSLNYFQDDLLQCIYMTQRDGISEQLLYTPLVSTDDLSIVMDYGITWQRHSYSFTSYHN